MQDLDEKWRRRGYGAFGAMFVLVGSIVGFNCGRDLHPLEHAWTSNDLRWGGLFMGVVFVEAEFMLLWNWLFARELTAEEKHLRNAMEDWQRERRRFFGGNS